VKRQSKEYWVVRGAGCLYWSKLGHSMAQLSQTCLMRNEAQAVKTAHQLNLLKQDGHHWEAVRL
jgi:hypothetical protein